MRSLLRMGVSELALRGRQETSKWLERVGAGRRDWSAPGLSAASLERMHARVRRAGGDPIRPVRLTGANGLAAGRFFEGCTDGHPLRVLASADDPARQIVLRTADAALAGRFDLLGYRGLSFGTPPDWHLDPVSGKRAPLVHWSTLDPLDTQAIGDVKVIWELNRQQWLLALGQAYQLSGDERYAEAAFRYLEHWRRANPPGMGINWACSLEVALRLIAWCWTLFLLRRSAALHHERLARLVAGIARHAEHVERYLSRYYSPNTHLTGEALGLFYAGVVLPELRSAARWRRLGRRILIQESARQIHPDGVYFEQATTYQRYTTEFYLHFLVLAAQNGIALPEAVGRRVRRMVEFLASIQGPDGSVPQIGDYDGGRLLPLYPRGPGDFGALFSIAAVLFDEPDFAWAARERAPETLWIFGASCEASAAAAAPRAPREAPSRMFAEGGYAVMRSGFEPEGHLMIVDVGPLGCKFSGGHGHADLLSVVCYAFGQPFLIDPGTYGYAAHPSWRHYFRSTLAHSTVTVDGQSQAEPAGAFSWNGRRPTARLRRWFSTHELDYLDADHDGYLRLAQPVVHRRRVLFIKPRLWVVVDDLEGRGVHGIELGYHFAPLPVHLGRDGWARARGARGALLVRAFSTVALRGELRRGARSPIDGWCSPDFGQRRPAPVLRYTTRARLPLRLLTLVVPQRDPAAPAPAATPLWAPGPRLSGCLLGHGRERVVIEDDGILLEDGR